jgi:phosphoribosylanthranilate isomerase
VHIKASRITNLTDARYFAAKEVAYLGFNLEENTEGYLEPMYMKAIREWVEGPLIAGEFERSPLPHVREAAAFFGLDAVELPAAALLEQPDALQGLRVLATLEAKAPDLELLMEKLAPHVAHFVLDLNGVLDADTGTVPRPDFWRACCARYPILLKADLGAAQWPQLLQSLQPAGISLVGGEEERVGVKSFDEIEAIFDVLG